MNVLVNSEDKLLKIVKDFVISRFDTIPITWTDLSKDHWISTCSLLILGSNQSTIPVQFQSNISINLSTYLKSGGKVFTLYENYNSLVSLFPNLDKVICSDLNSSLVKRSFMNGFIYSETLDLNNSDINPLLNQLFIQTNHITHQPITQIIDPHFDHLNPITPFEYDPTLYLFHIDPNTTNEISDILLKHNQQTKSVIMSSSPPSILFDFKLYSTFLTETKSTMGKNIIYSDILSSTQTFLTMMPLLPEYTCCLASHQTSGKGRGTNKWLSNLGILQFSFNVKSIPLKTLPFLQYVVSISIIECINHSCDVKINIKWPNDIYCKLNNESFKKIGGILLTTNMIMGSEFVDVCIGIGLDITNCESFCYSLNQFIKSQGIDVVFSNEQVLALFFNRFELNLELFREFGFKPFYARYYALWLHSKSIVNVVCEGGEKKVTILGIDGDGYLAAMDQFGSILSLSPDGNSFDLLNGLIVKKN